MVLRLANVFRLGLKELYSLRADPILLVMILYSFTLAVYSQATGAKTVPAVSTVMCIPRPRSFSESSTTPCAIIGSPPVITACRAAGKDATRSTMASTVISSPSGFHEVYGVSHQEQRRLQPLVRTKTEGTPARMPSP